MTPFLLFRRTRSASSRSLISATSTRTGRLARASGAAASRRRTGLAPPSVVAWTATWLAITRPTATRPGSTSRLSATIPWVCVGVSTNTALSLQIPAPGTNRIVVSNWPAVLAGKWKMCASMIWFFPFHWADEVIKNASSTGGVTSDDEDDESDNDESAEEGSADRLLVF